MTKERFKELSHAVAVFVFVFVFVFESSAFSSENDVPAVEGKDGKYTVHHVLRAARGMRAFIPQHLVEFEVKKETPDAPDVSIGKVRVDYDSSQNLKGSTRLSFGTFTRAGEYSYVLSEKKNNISGMEQSSAKYRLRVQVSSDGNGKLKIKCVTAETDGKKRDKIEFTDVIRKKGGLSISMNVQGDSADKQKEFPIVFKLSKAKTYDGNGIAEAIIENRDSKEKRKIRVAYGDQKQVSLKHGDVLRVVLPIGTGYWAYQKCERDGYSPDVWSSDGDSTPYSDSAGDGKYDFGLTNGCKGNGGLMDSMSKDVFLRGLDAKINVTNVFDGKKVSLIKTLPDDYLGFEIIGIIVVVCVIMGVAMVFRRKRL